MNARVAAPQAFGLPVMPKGLTKSQRELWNRVIDSLPKESIGQLDQDSLVELVWLSRLVEKTRKAAIRDPTDKENRLAYTSYYDRFHRLMGEFGMTPASRSRIKYEPDNDEPDDPAKEIFQRIGVLN